MLVQGDSTGDTNLSDLVKLYIKDRYNKPGEVFLGVTHRLDRPVSGVTIFARTSKALERMNALFAARKIAKTYLAITGKRPEPIAGKLIHFLLKNELKNVVRVFDYQSKKSKEAKQSELEYELIGEVGDQFLLKINPLTGRPHQIRAQLARIGCPIRGDLKYGYPKPNADGSIHLHCLSLGFEHPVKKEETLISASPPSDAIWSLFDFQI